MGVDSISFCVRVMVGVIILYDHVHKDGAFAKGTKIDVSVQITYAAPHQRIQSFLDCGGYATVRRSFKSFDNVANILSKINCQKATFYLKIQLTEIFTFNVKV